MGFHKKKLVPKSREKGRREWNPAQTTFGEGGVVRDLRFIFNDITKIKKTWGSCTIQGKNGPIGKKYFPLGSGKATRSADIRQGGGGGLVIWKKAG